mmetsp:Transcript_3030/g.6298  ORF Transcript_3030/g.6298 Transcript_3030/m.6298 type:complete len:431 (+) Transcript_3030:9-1301(+)
MLSRTPRRLYLGKAWEVVKRETKKVIQGCKVLWHDGKFLARKQYAIKFHGERYSLKEKKMMAQTSTDLLKMIPFSFFVVVPFSEIFLPPTLYLFPNMIPSTFLSKSKFEARMADVMRQRPQVADRIHSFMLERSKTFKEQYPELAETLRKSPQDLTLKNLEPYYDVFSSELTFGKMTNEQLMDTCAFLGVEPWTGFKVFSRAVMVPMSLILRMLNISFPREYKPKIFPFKQIYHNFVFSQLNNYLKQMREEDRVLLKEDFNKLEPELLRLVCYERGIDIELYNDAELKDLLWSWLRMSTYPTTRGLPSSNLLVMAQALQYVQDTLIDVEVPLIASKVEPLNLAERVLKFNPTELSTMLADLEAKKAIGPAERDQAIDDLRELLDKKIFMEQEPRIRSLIERLSILPGDFEEKEGPQKPTLKLPTEEPPKQ